MAVKNIARGGGKGGVYKADIQGLKELEKKLKNLSIDNPQLQAELFDVVGGASDELRDEMKAAAQAAGWGSQRLRESGRKSAVVVTGQEAIASIFSYSRPRGGSRTRISAIAGVGKPRTMVEWRAGRHPKSPRAKVAAGNPVAEAFATMLELGTSSRPARPAIRATIQGAKTRMLEKLAAGYNALLLKYSK